jgi:hypothetical protein
VDPVGLHPPLSELKKNNFMTDISRDRSLPSLAVQSECNADKEVCVTIKYLRALRLMTCENLLELYSETKRAIYYSETRNTWDYRKPS